METRLVPVNAVLDLSLPDGLNPAPLAAAGWRVAALEVPVRTAVGTVVCDVVLFDANAGHLLAVEAKSGANIEPNQGRKLAALPPELLVVAGGITVPRAVPLRCEALYVCLEENADRITLGTVDTQLPVSVLAVGGAAARLVRSDYASPQLAAAFPRPVNWTYPIAQIIPFDHESPDKAFDQPVRAELIAAMARGRSHVSIRALAEETVRHFALYGQHARTLLVRKVRDAARRAAAAEPDRLRYERATGTTEDRVAILRSPETFDLRGRTQGYQAIWPVRPRRGRRPAEIPGQIDLFSELDDAERVATEETGDNTDESNDDADVEPPAKQDPGLGPAMITDDDAEGRPS